MMRFSLLTACALGAATWLALSMPAMAYLYEEIRDWSVRCDNGLTCALQYEVMADGSGLTSLGFERTAAPAAPVEMVLGIDTRSVEEPEELSLAVDGENLLSLSFADARPDEGGWQWRFSPREGFTKLLAAMKAGTTLELSLQSGNGPVELDVPLAGVTAGLLFIDEAQGRIGRQDALEATGGAPVPDAASVRTIETVAELPPSIRSDFEGGDALCGGLEPATFSAIGAFLIDGGEAADILGVPCGLGGAYNQPFTLYAGKGDAFRALSFPMMGEDGPTAAPTAYNLSYEPVSGHLTAFFKGRGIGDCGSYQVWRIDSDMGAALTLLEERAKGECDGDYAGGPENWPLVWPSR